MSYNFKNKTLLITGGTGSFGNAVLKKFLSLGLKEIRIFSRDEKKQDDMRKKFHNSRIKFYIGDVRDFDSVLSATKEVDFIFNAAAERFLTGIELALSGNIKLLYYGNYVRKSPRGSFDTSIIVKNFAKKKGLSEDRFIIYGDEVKNTLDEAEYFKSILNKSIKNTLSEPRDGHEMWSFSKVRKFFKNK